MIAKMERDRGFQQCGSLHEKGEEVEKEWLSRKTATAYILAPAIAYRWY